MAKFKVGDKVKIVKRYKNNQTGGVDWYKPNGDVGKVGTVTDVELDDTYEVFEGDGKFYESYLGMFSNDELELASKSWDALEVGDVLTDNGGHKLTVLGVLNEVVFVSDLCAAYRYGACETKQGLRENGWKIEGAEPDTTELTMQEIADKFGVPVDTLKIKKGK